MKSKVTVEQKDGGYVVRYMVAGEQIESGVFDSKTEAYYYANIQRRFEMVDHR